MRVMPSRAAMAATPRWTMAVVWAVRQTAKPAIATETAAAIAPAGGQRSATPVTAPPSRAAASSSALTMPKLVGRR